MGNYSWGVSPYSPYRSPSFGYTGQSSIVVGGVLLAFLSVLSLYYLVAWIFRSIGLYHMAKDRGIAHAWFAWIPILGDYVLGRLINNKVVLGDNIVTKHAEFFLPFLGLMAASLTPYGNLASVFVAAVWVYKTSAYWRLYKIYRPKNRVSYTIWGALIGSGFFIFSIRDDRPFDPLEPNKVYQNFYGVKERVQDEFTKVRDEILNEESQKKEELIKDYEAKLNDTNLTESDKFELRSDLHKEERELKRETREEIDELDARQADEIKEVDELVQMNEEINDQSGLGFTLSVEEEPKIETNFESVQDLTIDNNLEDDYDTDELINVSEEFSNDNDE